MQILSVTAEIFPLAKTGGLADVAGSLPKALQAHGIHTRSFVPGYPGVVRALSEASAITEFDNLFGERATLLAGRAQGLDLFVLDAPGFYNRQGPLYTDTHGREYADNWKRFAAFSLVGSQIARGLVTNWRPDVIHAHDWHAAMSLLFEVRRRRLRSPCPHRAQPCVPGAIPGLLLPRAGASGRSLFYRWRRILRRHRFP